MALSNNQLLLLNNIIYTDYISNHKSVKDIIDDMEINKNIINACEMTSQE